MIGVLVSSKTFQGLPESPRYPALETVAGLFPDHPLALNIVHYHTWEREALQEQLVQITEKGGPNLHGIQLNVTWPPPAVLRGYRAAFPGKRIVLSVGSSALAKIGDSPEALSQKLADEYGELADYILFDPSGGRGKPFDTDRARAFLAAIERSGLGAGLVVAGGLSGATLDLVRPLLKDFPDLSFDAEGKLRDSTDRLIPELAAEYVRKAFALFESEGPHR